MKSTNINFIKKFKMRNNLVYIEGLFGQRKNKYLFNRYTFAF